MLAHELKNADEKGTRAEIVKEIERELFDKYKALS